MNPIPELRFPEFTENDFINHKFENIFNFSTGRNIKQKEASPDFETPCVRYGELYHMYNEVIYEVINRTNLDRNDLLFSDGDEILLPSAGEDPLDIGSASALTLPDIAIGRTINILKPKDDSIYSQIFVSYYINQKLRRKISSLAKGVSISNVYNSDLKKLRATLPSLSEQQKLASFLTAVDERLQLLQKGKTKLAEYKKGVMQKIFPPKGGLAPEIRFKDENGNDFPVWVEKKLGEICNKQSSNISANTLDESQGDYKVYGATGFLQYVDFYREEDAYISIVKDGAGVGRILLCEAKSSVLGTLEILKPKENNNIQFLYALISNIRFEKYITGSTIPHIYFKDYSKEKINVPIPAEQQKIADFLTSLDESIESIGKEIEGTTSFKKGLLQKMFV